MVLHIISSPIQISFQFILRSFFFFVVVGISFCNIFPFHSYRTTPPTIPNWKSNSEKGTRKPTPIYRRAVISFGCQSECVIYSPTHTHTRAPANSSGMDSYVFGYYLHLSGQRKNDETNSARIHINREPYP